MLRFLRKACDYAAYKFIRAPRGGGKPVPASALDAEYRSGRWDSFFGAAEKPRYDALVEIIAALRSRQRLLDAGCGSGRLAVQLVPDLVAGYTGFDLSEEAINRARSLALPDAKFLHASFDNFPPLADAFDVIVFNESIGYARDPAQVAINFASQLTFEGSLVVSHFRSANHTAIWRRLYRDFTFTNEKMVHNDAGLVWDIKVLQPRAHA